MYPWECSLYSEERGRERVGEGEGGHDLFIREGKEWVSAASQIMQHALSALFSRSKKQSWEDFLEGSDASSHLAKSCRRKALDMWTQKRNCILDSAKFLPMVFVRKHKPTNYSSWGKFNGASTGRKCALLLFCQIRRRNNKTQSVITNCFSSCRNLFGSVTLLPRPRHFCSNQTATESQITTHYNLMANAPW